MGALVRLGGVCVKLVLHAFNAISTWCFSMLATLGLPNIPIATEYYRSGSVAHETYYITSVILASTFLVTAQHHFFRVWYIILLALSIIFDMLVPAKGVAEGMGFGAGTILLVLALLHAAERFWWHVVDDRPFPG